MVVGQYCRTFIYIYIYASCLQKKNPRQGSLSAFFFKGTFLLSSPLPRPPLVISAYYQYNIQADSSSTYITSFYFFNNAFIKNSNFGILSTLEDYLFKYLFRLCVQLNT